MRVLHVGTAGAEKEIHRRPRFAEELCVDDAVAEPEITIIMTILAGQLVMTLSSSVSRWIAWTLPGW